MPLRRRSSPEASVPSTKPISTFSPKPRRSKPSREACSGSSFQKMRPCSPPSTRKRISQCLALLTRHSPESIGRVDASRVNRIKRAILVLLLLNFTTAFCASPDSKRIDRIFKPLVSENSPGLAVGVVSNGRLITASGYGVADLKTKTSITPATDFRLASLTKQFTATAFMLLVHDRKLDYEDTLTKIFPEFPSYGSTISIRHLLNHTSGLRHYEDIYDQQMSGTPRDRVPQLHDVDVLRLLEQQNAGEFVPGTRWEYSNSGYGVLAMIVERVSGERF